MKLCGCGYKFPDVTVTVHDIDEQVTTTITLVCPECGTVWDNTDKSEKAS